MDSPADADAAARLARRYPTRRGPLQDWRLVAILVALLGLGWLGWAAWQGAHPEVSARIDGFNVVSDAQIDVRLTVERPDPTRPAECSIFAQAITYERVGELVLPVPAGERLTPMEVSIRTFKRATTVDIESCRVTG